MVRRTKDVLMACVQNDNRTEKYQTDTEKKQRNQFPEFDPLKNFV